jgi:hypothetical protein
VDVRNEPIKAENSLSEEVKGMLSMCTDSLEVNFCDLFGGF